MGKIIHITKPDLPPLKEFIASLETIWESGILTNEGPFHEKFEEELCKFLEVNYISVVSSGTMALLLALRALEVKGEVITTPFSFVATSNAITWVGAKPVFIDINRHDLNLNAGLIKDSITSNVSAILPVHIFGLPCDVEKIDQVAKQNNLKVIYDASHCFGERLNGKSILNYGDLSVLSFHATKSFHTFEGGAVVSHSSEMKRKIDRLRAFGYENQETIIESGINGKLTEFQAALGSLQLKYFKDNIHKRKKVFDYYVDRLSQIPGIFIPKSKLKIERNYTFFPVILNPEFLFSREELLIKFQKNGILARRYFCPLISNLPDYCKLSSAFRYNLLNANTLSERVICLPIYPNLSFTEVDLILKQFQ